jgi:deoxyadenosine/deoxycytidine kinase
MRIAIEGNIGAGKSTFLQKLKKEVNDVVVIPEPVDEWNQNIVDGLPILEAFYKDPKRHAFLLQMIITLTRARTISQIPNSSKIYMMERSLCADSDIFGKIVLENNNINTVEYNTICELSKFMDNLFPIDLHVYLQVPAEVCFRRIQKRSRLGEENITLEYVQNLEKKYDTWYNNNRSRIMLINDNDDEEIANIMKYVYTHNLL